MDSFTVARFLGSPYTVYGLSAFLLLAVVFVAGFIAKMFDASLTWYENESACFWLSLHGSVWHSPRDRALLCFEC